MTFELEVPPPPPVYARQPFLWLMLSALIILMVGANLVTYFQRDESPKKGYASEDWALRSRLLFPAISGKGVNDRALEDAITQLNKNRKVDDLAEAYYAITSFELKGRVPKDSVDHLAKSNDPNLKILSKIYGSDKLSRAEADSLGRSITVENFRYRLARAHALQKAGVPGSREKVVSSFSKIAIPLLLVAIFLIFMLGLALLFGYAILYANGNIVPKGPPTGVLQPVEADQFAGKAAQLLVMFLALELLSGALASAKVVPKSAGMTMNLTLAILIIAGTVLMLRRDPITLRRIGWSKDRFGVHVLWGLGAAIANAPIVVTMALLGNFVFRGLPQAEHPIESALTGNLNPFKILVLFVLASIQAPIFEESTFRGLIQPAIAGIVNRPWIAGIISSLAFAAVHPTGIPAWPALAAIGGMSVFLTYQTKSLVPSMIMHGVHNAATLAISLLILQG